MNKNYIFIFGLLVLVFSFSQCRQHPKRTVKTHTSDPFRNSITPSQYFKIDAKQDNVVEGQDGTVLVFQKGSFIDASGNVIENNIDIELVETLSLGDMLLSNLTTTSGDQLLETDGMIYFNATFYGEQLLVNPEKPVYIQIPSSNRQSGMSVYQGIRDENGNMDWINPKPIENHLMALDIFSLDFLPDGFEEAVEKEMPFRNYEVSNQELIDSLYYSLYFRTGKEIVEEKVPNLDVNETYYSHSSEPELDSLNFLDLHEGPNYGVNPAIIKTIKNKKFQKTLIATRQFEERLKIMFKICRTDMVDVYVHNLDKNLWELDSIASSLLDDNVYQKDFKKFAAQKWTKIKEPNKNLKLLKRFYEKRLQSIKKQLTNQRNKVVKANNNRAKEAKSLIGDYKKLLNRREAYRMTGYGFTMTTTGWINIDRGTRPKNWEYRPLEFIVTNNESFNRVYGYVIYTSIKSLYRLNTKDSKTFYVGRENQREMIMPKNEKAIGIVVAYRKDQPFFKVTEFQTNDQTELRFNLQKTTKKDIKRALSKFNTGQSENSILEDLRYMDKIHLEEIRQDKLDHERFVMGQLKRAASPTDSIFLRFNRAFQIDMPIDTCLNKVRN